VGNEDENRPDVELMMTFALSTAVDIPVTKLTSVAMFFRLTTVSMFFRLTPLPTDPSATKTEPLPSLPLGVDLQENEFTENPGTPLPPRPTSGAEADSEETLPLGRPGGLVAKATGELDLLTLRGVLARLQVPPLLNTILLGPSTGSSINVSALVARCDQDDLMSL